MGSSRSRLLLSALCWGGVCRSSVAPCLSEEEERREEASAAGSSCSSSIRIFPVVYLDGNIFWFIYTDMPVLGSSAGLPV